MDAAADRVVSRFHYAPVDVRRAVQRSTRSAMVFAGVVAVVLVALMANKVSERAAPSQDPIFLVMLALMALTLAYGLWLGPSRVGRAFAQKYGGREVVATFDELGFSLESPDRLFVRHTWEEIKEVRETPDLFLVQLSSDLPLVVPKRTMAPADVDQVRQIVRERSRLR